MGIGSGVTHYLLRELEGFPTHIQYQAQATPTIDTTGVAWAWKQMLGRILSHVPLRGTQPFHTPYRVYMVHGICPASCIYP